MKKSQRLRFYALVAKQSQGKALSDTESAELKTLSTLAATHPSAETDTADETDDEKKKREDKEAADKKAEDDKKKEDDEKAKAALKPGVSARLAAAMASLGGGTPAQAAADLKAEKDAHAKTSGELTQAKADLSTAEKSNLALNNSLIALCDFLGLKPADISGKTQADIDGICTAKITAAATAQVAGMGLNPGKLPAPSGTATGDDLADIQAQMAATKDPVELGKLAAKANAIRDKKPAV